MSQNTTCQCTNHTTPVSGKYTCLAYVRGNVAYALDALPRTHVEITTGTPWAQDAIHLCGTHHTMFINGKAINITIPKEDNTMDTTRTRKQIVEELDSAKAKLREFREFPYTFEAIAYADAVGDRIDMLTEELNEFDTICTCCGTTAAYFNGVCKCGAGMCPNCTSDVEWKKLYSERFILCWMTLITGIYNNVQEDNTMNHNIIYIQTEYFDEETGNIVLQRIIESLGILMVEGQFKVYGDFDMDEPATTFGEMPMYVAFEMLPSVSLDEAIAAMRRHGDIRIKDWGTMDNFLSLEEFVAMLDRKWIAFEAQYNNNVQEDTMNINETISTNAIVENNIPTSSLGGSSVKDNVFRFLCTKCTKEIGENWYHANVADLRTCMGAAPAPVRGNKANVRINHETGVTEILDTNLLTFFDASAKVCIDKAKELRANGVEVIKVAKAQHGLKNWFVLYKKS